MTSSWAFKNQLAYILISRRIIRTNIPQFFGLGGLYCWDVLAVFVGGKGVLSFPFH